MTQRRWTRVEPDVLAEIDRLGQEGWSAPKIREKLGDETRFTKPVYRVPSIRTIQAKLREAPLHPTAADRWLLREADPNDAALVLPALALAQRALGSGGGPAHLTRAHADWIVRLRRGTPDMPVAAAYTLASAYWSAERRGWGTAALDRFVALELWAEPLDDQLDKQLEAYAADWTDVVMTRPGVNVYQLLRARGIPHRRQLRHLILGRTDGVPQPKGLRARRVTAALDAAEKHLGIATEKEEDE